MTIRSHGMPTLIAFLMIACWGSLASAQDTTTTKRPQSPTHAATQAGVQSESQISAEMVKGKLNPATSKPGDEIAVRLNEDVKSEGNVVLKKGTTIRGVVRKVRKVESNRDKGEAKGAASAQSMMELEWLTPALSGTASQQLNLALQSVAYTNPLYAQSQEPESDRSFQSPGASAPNRGTLTGGLVGGTTGAASSITAVGTGATSSVSAGVLAQTSSGVATPILPANTQTASSLQNNFDVTGDSLFHVGGGQVISSGGTAASLDLFSHLSNDTVITSPSRNFEISSGAQMNFLVQTKQR